jgi:diguanylate cyclase (GGDEF)-like protein/PAS domain S-box-containing protein
VNQLSIDVLKNVFDLLDDYIFIKDINYNYIYGNKKVCHLFGLSLEEIIGKNDTHFFDLNTFNDIKVYDTAVIVGEKVIEKTEKMIMMETSQARYYKTTKQPLYDSQNKLVGLFGLSIDITEQKVTEEKLEEKESLLRLVLDENPDVIIMKDFDGKFILVNKTVSELYQVNTEDMIGKDDGDYIPKEQADFFRENIQKIMKAGKTEIVYEDSTDRNTGETRHFKSVKKPLKDKDGNDQILVIATDITDIVKTKEELKYIASDLQKAQSLAKIGFWRYKIEEDIVTWSDEVYKIYQIDKIKSPVKKFDDFFSTIDPKYIEIIQEAYTKHLQDGKPYEITNKVLLKDGTSKWIYDKCETFYDDNGKPIESVGVIQDVTDKELLNAELKSSHAMFAKLSKNIPGAIFQYKLLPDGNTSFLYLSDGIREVYELEPKALIEDEQLAFNLFHSDDLNMILESIQESAETMNDWDVKYRVNLPKKGLRWIETYSKPEKLEDGSILWHGYIHDITDRKSIENKLAQQKDILHYQAHHDALTGLPNRTLFQDRLEQAIAKAKRNNSKVALLFIDLDHFKEINDSLGHDVGDEILKIVTTRLEMAKRDEDTLARLGGDEFTIILEDLHQIQDASLVSNKILKSLSASMNVNDNILYVSSSIGISIYPDDGESAQSLLKFADSAMYKAKDEGRNNFQYYNASLTELAFERVVMESSLRSALKNEEFVVYYQAQVNGDTNSIIGMEALVRWEHPRMGLVSPSKFIPLAESTGLIIDLDRYVMKTAMTQISQWYKEGLNPGVLAMNLAVKQLQKKDFITIVQELIKETNCKAEWLSLEVTEGQIMTHPEEAIVILQKISDLGIELAVDDFGTGYSSLAYLKRLPIDKLKIDQEFVRNLPGDEEDEGITKAVIALAKSLKLKVIAEGVETKEQRDFIVENGCPNIQGYFYSKPIPASEYANILRNGF